MDSLFSFSLFSLFLLFVKTGIYHRYIADAWPCILIIVIVYNVFVLISLAIKVHLIYTFSQKILLKVLMESDKILI